LTLGKGYWEHRLRTIGVEAADGPVSESDLVVVLIAEQRGVQHQTEGHRGEKSETFEMEKGEKKMCGQQAW